MHPLRSSWIALPFLLSACSFLNAPADIETAPPTTSGSGAVGGTGGAGGTGGGGTAGTTTTTTAPPDVCGDGSITGAEACDDDNTTPGDGCSATCTIEDGYACTGSPSMCAKTCGDGKIDAGEDCDDGGMGDVNPAPGDQDYCTPGCKLKEFDIEAATDGTVNNEQPVAGYRDEAGTSSFYVIWHSSVLNKVLGRQYKFDGSYLKGTGSVDLSTTQAPDVGGHRICTAESKRSLVLWRDKIDSDVYARKIESNGTFFDPLPIGTSEPNPSCAAASAFVGVVMAKNPAMPGFWDIIVQPYTSFAAPNGGTIDIGDSTAPNKTSAWPLSMGFLVAWIVDPANNTPITSQLLDKDGKLQSGFIYQLSDAMDVAPREPWGERVGPQDQFALAYTRDSLPDAMGVTHREVALRLFKAADMGSAPAAVSADTNPQREPRIGVNPTNGKFVVTWTGGPPNAENIMMRAFDPAGKEVSAEAIVNENQVGQQTASSVAVDPVTGSVVVVWDNYIPNSGKPHKSSAKIFAGLLK